MFSVSRAMLFRWQQKYDQGGPVALETKKTPGPASRLSPTQLSKLYAIITGSDPRQLEFDFGLWTRKIIRELIRREFGVKLSEVQVGRLLNKIGLSPQRPLYRAYQQDPERVAEWKKSAYPKIRKLAAEEGASIFFADEASIRTDHHAGTTWAPVGQTPVVITTGERKSVNMVSAISPRGELRFRVQEGTMNAGKFIDFLKALLDSVPGKIFLIVDGHPVHKAKKVSEFVKEKADGRLSIFFLPPYSPDLDPDEWVWNNVKNDRIGRSVIMSADDLKAKAIGALRRLQKLPGIVRGFLRDPKLAYILELHRGTAHGVYKGISSLVSERATPRSARSRVTAMAGDAFEETLAGFRRWAGTTERKLSGDPEEDAAELYTVFSLMPDYLGIDAPSRLTAGRLNELLLHVYPRKVTVLDRKDVASTIPALRDLTSYLADTGAITAATERAMDRELDEVEPDFADAVMDPSNWGRPRR